MSTALGRTCQKLLLMAANRNIQVVAFTFFSRSEVFVRLCSNKGVFRETVFMSCSSRMSGTRESPGVYPDSQVGFTTSDVLCASASILPTTSVQQVQRKPEYISVLHKTYLPKSSKIYSFSYSLPPAQIDIYLPVTFPTR